MPLGAIDYGSWALALAVKLAAVAGLLLALRPLGAWAPASGRAIAGRAPLRR